MKIYTTSFWYCDEPRSTDHETIMAFATIDEALADLRDTVQSFIDPDEPCDLTAPATIDDMTIVSAGDATPCVRLWSTSHDANGPDAKHNPDLNLYLTEHTLSVG